jgi:hypothetical protein
LNLRFQLLKKAADAKIGDVGKLAGNLTKGGVSSMKAMMVSDFGNCIFTLLEARLTGERDSQKQSEVAVLFSNLQ